jgi:hypothetical protein
MNKYLYLYSGLAHDPNKDMAENEAQMAAWMQYFGKLGTALVEGGAPFTPQNRRLGAAAPSGATGYSVVQAANLDEAASLTEGHPHLASGGSIEVFEFMMLPGM